MISVAGIVRPERKRDVGEDVDFFERKNPVKNLVSISSPKITLPKYFKQAAHDGQLQAHSRTVELRASKIRSSNFGNAALTRAASAAEAKRVI